MDSDMARATREFLLRAELKGAEVPIWLQCMRALEVMMQPVREPVPTQMENAEETANGE